MAKVFLSHSNVDKEDVRRLAQDLKRVGIDVWLDELEIGIGDSIPAGVQEGLASSDYLAVWLTQSSARSPWVGREWQSRFGAELEGRSTIILPLLAEDCEIPPLLENKRCADFRKDYNHGFTELLTVTGLRSWRNPFGMQFTLIMPGTFVMGTDEGDENERPAHSVTISRPFYMGIHTVTQAAWREVMDTQPWKGGSHVREGDDYPAVNISWYDADDFVTRLGQLDQNTYLLPTEEEWEYAARAGSSTAFSFGDDHRELRFYGWYRDIIQRGEEYARPVGKKKPNQWGLYDMHGNIWEWTEDWYYGSYAAQRSLNPIEKVLRGGGWDYPAYGARSAFRNHLLPSRSDYSIEFRLIRRGSVGQAVLAERARVDALRERLEAANSDLAEQRAAAEQARLEAQAVAQAADELRRADIARKTGGRFARVWRAWRVG